ncbi:MAG: ChbG/HpnK family deacetylase [Deltaproteobacteria bacterium]|nr:ChbG/HpnK family deacetylase [Deltaproteobacteria bacterium]
MTKHLVINADDFGYAQGVNRGVIAAHECGVVLSASLMVDMPLAREAAAFAAAHPGLGVGLHFAVTDTKGPKVDLLDVVAIERALYRQYRLCCDLLGHAPTHIDSHHHIHMRKELFPLFVAWAAAHHLPLRSHGAVTYNGGFYGQWYDEDWQPHPAPELIHLKNLEKIFRDLPEGATELACHPAYLSPDLDSSYASEREIELATLLNPRVLSLARELGITLVNFATLPTLLEKNNVAA